MKFLYSLIILILFSLEIFAQGELQIKDQHITLKNLLIDDQPTTVTYKLKNIGNQPVIISRIVPFNSYLKVKWDKAPLAPGKSNEIYVSFPSNMMQENFNHKIIMYTNTHSTRIDLQLSGNLIENPAKPELTYKFNMEGVRFKTNYINFDKIYIWQTVTDSVPFLNMRQEPVSISAQYKPAYIQIKAIPEKVEPGKKGLLLITYNAPQKNDYGYSYESLILSFNKDRNYNHRLSLSANLAEDFSKLSDQELANAPVAVFDKKETNFGEIEPGSKADCDFTLTNTGKRPLTVRKVKASCGCTAVTLGEKKIAPGQSTVIRATFDSTGKSGHQYKSINVITNDPKNPEITLNIKGNIKKS